ncbi:HAMP domain-containing sensor histidine kinase [Nocardia sp. NPDC055321]
MTDARGPLSAGESGRQAPIGGSITLHRRVTLLAASVVTVAVAVTSIAAYSLVARSLYDDVDTQLRTRATFMISKNVDRMTYLEARTLGSLFSDDIGVTLIYPGGGSSGLVIGSDTTPPLGDPEMAVARGELDFSLRTIGDRRVLAQHINSGVTLVIEQRLQPTRDMLDRLTWLLFLVGGCGILLAAAAGTAVARTGLRPVARLTSAIQRVAQTDDLAPIPVSGDDELATLTERFNTMLRALSDSRERQRRLVADAGHELKTPLTSLRTNAELLIASDRPGAPSIPDEDMAELRDDVMAQIQELSTLVGDLVDLAREDVPDAQFERVDVAVAAERALERVRRRRGEVEFDAELRPWCVYGDQAGLERALLNVMDNAAKWSPAGSQVRIAMVANGRGLLEFTVDDAGPGIEPGDRELVFERFYRATSARSMPGSGLGLAIVKQIVLKHGGTVAVESSARGGTLIRIVLPGEQIG